MSKQRGWDSASHPGAPLSAWIHRTDSSIRLEPQFRLAIGATVSVW